MILKELEDLNVITLPDGKKAYLKEEVDEVYKGLHDELYAAYSELDTISGSFSRKALYKQIDDLSRKVQYLEDMNERLKEEYARLQRRIVH